MRLARVLLVAAASLPGWAQGADGPGWMPPDLSREERQEWQSGGPPGWTRKAADARGASTRPPATGEPEAAERLRRWGRERGIAPPVMAAALAGLEGAARHGVPVETAERVVRAAAERGIAPRGIEAITRALAYGAERHALMPNLESFAREALIAGTAADTIALGIYQLAAAGKR